jgi:uncharacterized RDD family membrane protein YckC
MTRATYATILRVAQYAVLALALLGAYWYNSPPILEPPRQTLGGWVLGVSLVAYLAITVLRFVAAARHDE